MMYYSFKLAGDPEFSSLDAPKEGCWIHVDNASTKELEEVCRLTNLEYTDLIDSLDKYELPRLDFVSNNMILFVRHPIDLEGGLYTMTLTILLTRHYFITISPRKPLFIQTILANKLSFSSEEKTRLLIHLLLKISQEFTSQVKRVRHSVLMQEKEISNIDSEDITALTRNEETFNQYLSALSPTKSVLEIFLSGKYTDLYPKGHDLVEDLVNAVKQAENLCSINLTSISNLKNSYQTIFTNNLSKTIRLLTALTIIFSIPTTVSSIFGMNVSLPFAHIVHAFWVIIGVMTVVSLAGIYLFHRKKWL